MKTNRFMAPSDELYAEGLKLMRKKKYKDAIKKFELAYYISRSRPALWQIALCHIALGSFNRALRATYRLYGSEPDRRRHESHLIRGYVFYRMAERQETREKATSYYTKAWREFNQLVKESRDPRAHFWRGLAGLRMGRLSDAVSDFAVAEGLPSLELESRLHSGSAYEAVGAYHSSIDEYERALSLTRKPSVAKQLWKIIRRLRKKVPAREKFEGREKGVADALADNPAYWTEPAAVTVQRDRKAKTRTTLYHVRDFMIHLGAIVRALGHYFVLSGIEGAEYEIEVYDMKLKRVNSFRARNGVNVFSLPGGMVAYLRIGGSYGVGFRGDLKAVRTERLFKGL